ncbi:phosphate regulon sensor histidine kinase PhoR [Phytohalomonas tamaricis]|uniref:phosphate regulon sensor histidine kinase PhoR n=1 Tax=Phytohalomonas tamaricis TaxID=2081032 RepID=UPI000D0AC859|nr:phosphate regulon sensor histidine kinase PhoR [Phytohalomonas tamaricis]
MHYWTNELWRLSYLVIGFGVLGALLGQPGWGVALGLAVHMAFTLRHLKKLYTWLSAPADQAPPVGEGVWGDLFDRLYRYQKTQRHMQGRLRSVLNRVQESSEALRDGVVMLDRHGALDWWNDAAERMLGLDAGKDRGQHLTNLMRDPRFIRYYTSREYREPLTLPSPILDGRMLEFQITVFGDDECLLIIRDVTRLVRLEQTRRDFVANVSHELRTPLTVIAGYLETYLDQAQECPDALPSRMMRGLGQMQEQSTRMRNLVEDLLTLSRLETSERQSEDRPIDIAALCAQVRADGESLANGSHTLELVIEESRALFGDEQEIRSALSNLVFNAVRYTPAGSTITLCYRPYHKGAALEVIDNGEGIPEVHLSRLTERFYRIDKGRSAASGGTGLGLAIVKHVLLRHDAKLEIESEIGEGTLFRCVFPESRLKTAS